MLEDGERVLVEYEDLAIDDGDFPDVGAAFEDEVGAVSGEVGNAEATLVDMPALVDFGVDWMTDHR